MHVYLDNFLEIAQTFGQVQLEEFSNISRSVNPPSPSFHTKDHFHILGSRFINWYNCSLQLKPIWESSNECDIYLLSEIPLIKPPLQTNLSPLMGI